MKTTRRAFLGGLGGLTAAGFAGRPERGSAASRSSPTARLVEGPRCMAAALTPVDRSGRFDEALSHDLWRYLEERGLDGVVAFGTTGEFASFSVAERKRILERMLEARGGLDVICHVGATSLPDTLDLLEHAGGVGVDAVMALPPFFFRNVTVDGLERFFAAVLEASRVPVLMYHFPAMSGAPITHELLRRLEGFDRLYGIKDSSGDEDGLMEYIREFPKLRVFTGSPRLLAKALGNGAAGCITGNANVIPAQTAAVFEAFRSGGDVDAAQERLNEAGAKARGDMPAMKYMLELMGLRESFCRPPLVEVSPERKAEIRSRAAGVFDT
jgi:4-hydroxy-tetrahydrodipicolinate synthase